MRRRRQAITDELGPIDWREVHRRGLQGPAATHARLEHTWTPEQEAAARAIQTVHHARQLGPAEPEYTRRRDDALAVAHLVPFRAERSIP